MILSPLDYIHEWVQLRPWHSATLPPGLQYMYIYVYVYVYIYMYEYVYVHIYVGDILSDMCTDCRP